MILYRGTPQPEKTPQMRDFPGVFFSKTAQGARQYGKHVQKYQVDAEQRLLSIDDPEARRLAFFHTGEKPETEKEWQEMLADLFMFPDEEWVQVLRSKGYTGTRIGNDIFLAVPFFLSVAE